MKIKTSQAAEAYKVLKTVKVNGMNNEATSSVWKAIMALRPISSNYDKDIEDVRKTLQDKEYEKMQPRLVEARNKEIKAQAGEYTLTDKDIKEAKEVAEWLNKWSAKGDKLFNEVSDKEIEVKLTKIDGQELLKGFKDQDITFETLESLEWLIK